MNDVDVEAWQTSACSCRIDLALSTVRPLRHRPLPSPCTARWAPTCRDRLIDYRSLFPAMKARRLAATTMAAPCGRTEPRLLVGAQSHSPDGRKRTIALARHVRSEPCTFAVDRRFLESRLAYRIQELAYGGLSRETLERLRAMAKQYATRDAAQRKVRPLQRPIVGTKLIREYQGVEHCVTVRADD